MTNHERRLNEKYHRARKAARLALTLARYGNLWEADSNDDLRIRKVWSIDEIVNDPATRRDVASMCGYGHVSDETWVMVREMLKEVK